MKILVIQSAFLGDVVLTLPLAQELKRHYPDGQIDMLATPQAKGIAESSPCIRFVHSFDKKGSERGAKSLLSLGLKLRKSGYDIVVCPHRSFRSGVLVALSGAAIRVGFRDSALPFVFNRKIRREPELHEADRNLRLLMGLGFAPEAKERPILTVGREDTKVVDAHIAEHFQGGNPLIAIAPGSVWFTKRWPEEKFASLVSELERRGQTCVLIGGKEDAEACRRIVERSGAVRSWSSAGRLSLIQSAEVIRRSSVLVSNDSAPTHLGVAVKTRVVAIFGPTVPAYGFAPYGEGDVVVERSGLACRPCTKHGGAKCPIGTFECMESLEVSVVVDAVLHGRSSGNR